MNKDNNEILASVWQNSVMQTIIVFPLVWRHEPYGNWICIAHYVESFSYE